MVNYFRGMAELKGHFNRGRYFDFFQFSTIFGLLFFKNMQNDARNKGTGSQMSLPVCRVRYWTVGSKGKSNGQPRNL